MESFNTSKLHRTERFKGIKMHHTPQLHHRVASRVFYFITDPQGLKQYQVKRKKAIMNSKYINRGKNQIHDDYTAILIKHIHVIKDKYNNINKIVHFITWDNSIANLSMKTNILICKKKLYSILSVKVND